jgi:hypothetical protein
VLSALVVGASHDTVALPSGVTVTATDRATLPPAPLHVNVKVDVAVSAPVDCVPVVSLAPVHAPEAVQVVALVDAQVNVDALPDTTAVGFAVNVSVGCGRIVTVTA